MSEVEARSVLAALLESVPSIGINRADVDGTVATVGRDVQAIVLFDSVPGGAGHAQRIYRLLPDLAQAAYRRSAECSCGEETSCYGCLRSFSNQLWHEELARGLASGVLSGALPAT